MIVSIKSTHSGIIRNIDLDVTQDQLDNYFINKLSSSISFPNLGKWEKEFIESGMTEDEFWESLESDDRHQK